MKLFRCVRAWVDSAYIYINMHMQRMVSVEDAGRERPRECGTRHPPCRTSPGLQSKESWLFQGEDPPSSSAPMKSKSAERRYI